MPPILTIRSLGASPWRRHYWRRELGGEPQSKVSESPILASLKSLATQLFEPPPPVAPSVALLSAMAAVWRPIPRRYRARTLPTYWPRPWRPAAARRGSTEAQGGPQGRDDGSDGLSDGHIGELHEAADERRPAKPIADHLLIVLNGADVQWWRSRRPLRLLLRTLKVHG